MRSRTLLPALVAAALAGALAGLGNLTAAASSDGTREREELVFLIWSEFLDPALVAKFEESRGARIRQVYFETNEARDRKLVESDGKGYDLAVVNDVALLSYRNRGWLAPLDVSNAPNLKHVDPRWYAFSPAAEGHAVPYFWGTLGIAYRADLIPGGITSWKQFFEPGEKLKHKIATTGDSADLIGMALKCLGYSANSIAPAEVAAAEALLLKQKPFVRTHQYISLTKESAMVTGEVAASMAFNGDALMLAEHNDQIKYIVPEEGGNVWADYLVVLNGSAKKELARAFVDFLNEPGNAAQLAQYVYYATPNLAAEALLPADFLADPIIYPPADVLARSEAYRALPPRAEKRRSSIYARAVD